jgi:peptidase A4-like protein
MAGQWLGVVGAVIAVVLGAPGCGGGSGGSGAPSSFGHMAGYVWSGHVRAVAASWAVPRMSGTGEAHASTWIGAQAPGRSQHSPFIQVGTVEDRGSSRAAYGAFWTDTARGFHPQLLFHVHPGDAVSTALTLAADRWRVYIVDTTSGQRTSFATSEEAMGDFNLAEWLQENPTSTSGKVTPYPGLSPVRMRALAINGAVPRYGDVFAQWMSLPGGDLAPTPLHDGAFAITRGVLTLAGRRYLEIARPQNVSARRVDLEEVQWTQHTPPSEIERVSAAAAASERRYAGDLARARWPAAAQAPISSLVREVRLEADVFASAARHAPASLTAWQRRFAGLTPALLQLAHEVRRALHVPELVSGQLPPSAARRIG